MTQRFEENPILNSPYLAPGRHWVLGEDGKPTGQTREGRRVSSYLVPIPKARGAAQSQLVPDKLEENFTVNNIRELVNEWRALPPAKQNISHPTRRLLEHWRRTDGGVSPRLFFCQIEAAETLIWLNEVAPHTKKGAEILREIKNANDEANPGLFRLAAKMATGAGKTTVMAMMIAYHAVNKARNPRGKKFADHFLLIAPGITIKDRLRVLLPQDPNNYYKTRRIVPPDMMREIGRARVVAVNFQALKLREKMNLPKKSREILAGHDSEFCTTESEGEMLKRVCPELLRADNALVINDEAHHCFRRKTEDAAEDESRGASAEEKEEIERGRAEARLWISGIESLSRKVPLHSVYDLSATPFFLKGAGYPEGYLFRWVVSDFSLMDAMESGVVKLPRVPVDDATITADNLPVYRNLYHHIKDRLPRKGSQKHLNPANLPPQLTGALQAMYSQYKKVHSQWSGKNIVPPVFIVICNNTSVSKLVYDYISGYHRGGEWTPGAFALFNNLDNGGRPLARPRTLLIDSARLESGEGLTDEFKKAAAAEIEVFKREMRVRSERGADKISDEELLREVMNTVGKEERLGEQIRCVVSVSMLTEGWDASNVTHILGVRAFGTQLICEQAVGRALRRINYATDENGMLSPEYADICGVPFNFASGVKAAAIKHPEPPTRVRHLDERAALEIRYPRIIGYKLRPPEEHLTAKFSENSRLTLAPEMAPPKAKMHGIIGEGAMLTLDELKTHRENEAVFFIAAHAAKKYADEDGRVPPSRFRDLVPITRLWIRDYLTCLGNTFPQYLLWLSLANMAAERIVAACTTSVGKENLAPEADPFTPEGSTFYVDYPTRARRLHHTRADKSHINIAVCDSDWELHFCRLLEDDPGVLYYARNAGLGFDVPYEYNAEMRHYRPDFIVLTNDGDGRDNPLHLIVEIKGFRKQDARAKADTMERYWIPSVNNDGRWGRWAFVEIMDMQDARAKLAQFTRGGGTQ